MDPGILDEDTGDPDSPFSARWQIDDLEYDCDCPGPPPPIFKIPPPPRPPFLPDLDCSDFNVQDFESCDLMTVMDAEYHGSPTLPTLTIIGICITLLLVGFLIVFGFAWKNKKKMQSFLPCKSSPQNRCDSTLHGNGAIYEDLTNSRPRNIIAHPGSFEMLDVKSAHGNSYVIGGRPPVFMCSPPMRQEHQYYPPPRPQDSRRYCSQDLYNPVYEELSNGSGERGESDGDSEFVAERAGSEDEFAEDELSLGDHYHLPNNNNNSNSNNNAHLNSGTSSLQGSTGNDLYRDVDSSDADDRSRFLCHSRNNYHHHGGSSNNNRNLSLPPGRRTRNPRYPHRSQNSLPDHRRPRSLDRRRITNPQKKYNNNNININNKNSNNGPPIAGSSNEFHEGLLLDALFQLYPNFVRNHPDRPQQRLPYILPVNNTPESSIVNPYETIPVLDHLRNHRPTPQQPTYQHQQYYPSSAGVTSAAGRNENFTTFRPSGKPTSQDSDSGYSNNTSGGHGSNNSSRSRNDTLQRLSNPSDYPI